MSTPGSARRAAFQLIEQAERAFDEENWTLAVIFAGTAADLAAEETFDFVTSAYGLMGEGPYQQGVDLSEYTPRLRAAFKTLLSESGVSWNYSRFVDLFLLVSQLKGERRAEFKTCLKNFKNGHVKVRNKVVHDGHEPTREEARASIDQVRALIGVTYLF